MRVFSLRSSLLSVGTAVLLVALAAPNAFGLDVESITVGPRPTVITGGGIYSVAGTARTPAVFKLRIRVSTAGRIVLLCLGSQADLSSGACPQPVASSSRDAGGQVRDGLGIIDTPELLGKLLYVKNITSGAPANDIVAFVLTIE